MTGQHDPERLMVTRTTADFFRAIGVSPVIGRAYTREEDAPGKNTVAGLSSGMGQTRFAGNPDFIGTTIDLDGTPTRIIGVMPQGFEFPLPGIKMWLP